MELEDEERRREKRQQMAAAAQAKQAARSNPLSPAVAQDTGAMDALLNKLRAAGPTSRDKREARRRARLRQNGAVRAASITKEADTGGESDKQDEPPSSGGAAASPDTEQAPTSPDITVTAVPDEDSLTKRTEEMLMRLRGDGAEGATPSPLGKGSLRDKRKERRRRNGSNVSMSSTNSGSISLSLATSPPVPPLPTTMNIAGGGLTAFDGAGDGGGEDQVARAKNALMAMRRGSDAGSIGSATSEQTPTTRTELLVATDGESTDGDRRPLTPTTIVSPPSPERTCPG